MHIDRFEKYYIVAAAVVLGVFFASLIASALVFGLHPAQPGGFINPLTIDQTAFASPGLRDMGNGSYEVYIVAQMWRFDAGSDEQDVQGNDVLRVPAGSRVTFYVTSRDVTHGFIIEQHNVNFELVPGHVAQGTVTFHRPGTYAIICHEYCGRGHQTMHMSIVVEPAA